MDVGESKKLLGEAVLGNPTFFRDLPPGTLPGSHSEESRKISCDSEKEKGRINIVKYFLSILYNKGMLSREKTLTAYPNWEKGISTITTYSSLSASTIVDKYENYL